MEQKIEKKMYQNPVMEWLTRSSPQLMIPYHFILASLYLYGGYSSGYTSNFLVIIGLFVSGMFFWTFAEYALHRWVFHFVNDMKIVKVIHYALHGYHHEEPRDHHRLFMPPVPAFLILISFFGLFYLFMGKAAWFFLPGFEMGYLMYAFVHYSVHTRKPPRGMGFLWRHHGLHHHQYPGLAFGVSNTFWDKLFRTMPPIKEAGKKG